MEPSQISSKLQRRALKRLSHFNFSRSPWCVPHNQLYFRFLSDYTQDGDAYVLGTTKDAEAIMSRCRNTVLDSLHHEVEDTLRDLTKLWDANQKTILSLLQDVAGVAKHRHIAEIINSTVRQLDKVRRLDPDKIRIAVSGTSGEAAVGANNKRFWTRLRSRSTGPVSDLMASEAANQTGTLARLTRKFIRSITLQPTLPKHSANLAVSERACPPSDTSRERSEEALPSSAPDPEDPTNLAIAVRPASIAKGLGIDVPELQGSIPTIKDVVSAVNSDLASKGQGPQDKGTVKLTRDVLCNHVMSTSFHPEISRVKMLAQSCMTESLNEMAALAHRAAVGALAECYEVVERQIEAQKSMDTKQLRAETSERLACWGNLVATQGAIQEMKRLRDTPIVRAPLPRHSSTHPDPLSPASSHAG